MLNYHHKESNISLKKVFKHLFDGLKPHRALAAASFVFYTLSYIFSAIVPFFYKVFFDVLSQDGYRPDQAKVLLNTIIVIAFLNFGEWLFFRGGFFTLNYTESLVMARLKQNAFAYIIRHSHNFFANNFTGAIVQKINRFARAFERIFDTLLFQMMSLFISILAAVIASFLVSPIISLVIFLWVAFYLFFGIIFYRWKMKYDIILAEADSATTGLLSDDITNSQPISMFGGTDYETRAFEESTTYQAKASIKTWNFAGLYDTIQLFIVFVVEFLVFFFAIRYWQAGEMTVGSFVMIQTYIISLGRQIWLVNRVIRDIFESTADSKQLVELLEEPHEIQDVPQAAKLSVSTGAIEFRDTRFRFNKGKDVLNGLNLQIKPGEKIAIVGPSGAGKTTFIRLLLRIYDLAGGSILIDGQDIRTVTQDSLRQNISLVPQDPVLFHRSLLENIRYGRREATDEEVIMAARLAHCDDFIENLPLKYETFVGERGIKLSGGERQRVAIARAFLKRAPILILDEATSSLDSHSEALIQDALDALMKNCTTIVIAHRLSTIKKMDRIIVMNDGRIAEEGTHDELANRKSGLYKKLWTLQAGGFIQK